MWRIWSVFWKAVRARGAALQFAPFEFRIDHDVVLEAVKQDPHESDALNRIGTYGCPTQQVIIAQTMAWYMSDHTTSPDVRVLAWSKMIQYNDIHIYVYMHMMIVYRDILGNLTSELD